MKIAELTWPTVDEYLKNKKTILIPIGSTEQHGPTGIMATDYLTAEHLCYEVGKRSQTLVAPPLCYGMAQHHLAFPGTCSFRPSTFISVIEDIVHSFGSQGFEVFLFVNGHGGNMAPTTTAFCEIKSKPNLYSLNLISWFKMPEVMAYEEKHFGDENGFHATCGEVSLTQYIWPQAFEKIESRDFKVEKPETHYPLSASEFRRIYPDGRMRSNPGLASHEHGKAIHEIAVDALCKRLQAIEERYVSSTPEL